MPLFDPVRTSKSELCDDHTLHGTRPDLWVELRDLDIFKPLALLIR